MLSYPLCMFCDNGARLCVAVVKRSGNYYFAVFYPYRGILDSFPDNGEIYAALGQAVTA